MSERVGRSTARRGSAGFSLIELLVVVIIIGILAALAIPTMSTARYDREAYTDAGSIMMLFREARMRAIARGGAEMLAMTASGTGDRGTFMLWEAVSQDPTANGMGGSLRLPVPNCMAPTTWPPPPANQAPNGVLMTNGNQGVMAIDGVNLNGLSSSTVEVVADIETQLYYYQNPTNNTAVQVPAAYVCFTPLGRSYVNAGGNAGGLAGAAQPVFDGMLPSVGVLEARVMRGVNTNLPSAQIRSVLLPPNGMARLFSHT